MGINIVRVLLGGIAAGLIINLSEFVMNAIVLADDWKQIMTSLNRPAEISGTQMAWFNVMGFALGVVTVWLYAAIRPRFGAGLKTALVAGGFIWLVAYLIASIPYAVNGFMTAKVMEISLAWGLAELLLAAAAGGALYKEGVEARAPAPRAATT
jgi:hypothetical protein